jgi:hypothetical protein
LYDIPKARGQNSQITLNTFKNILSLLKYLTLISESISEIRHGTMIQVDVCGSE